MEDITMILQRSAKTAPAEKRRYVLQKNDRLLESN